MTDASSLIQTVMMNVFRGLKVLFGNYLRVDWLYERVETGWVLAGMVVDGRQESGELHPTRVGP